MHTHRRRCTHTIIQAENIHLQATSRATYPTEHCLDGGKIQWRTGGRGGIVYQLSRAMLKIIFIFWFHLFLLCAAPALLHIIWEIERYADEIRQPNSQTSPECWNEKETTHAAKAKMAKAENKTTAALHFSIRCIARTKLEHFNPLDLYMLWTAVAYAHERSVQ